MHTVSASKFLIGLLIFFVYFVVVFGFAAIFGKTPVSKRKERRKQDIFFQFLVFAPIAAVFVYVFKENFAYLILPVAIFVFIYEFAINRPRLNHFIAKSEDLYKALKLFNQEDKYSFDAANATILLNWDMPQYIKGNLYDLRIDRVCKNKFENYFWVQASIRGFFEPSIKLLTLDAAKNLLRKDKESYLKEFNEEPI
jgi:hypothetical protein